MSNFYKFFKERFSVIVVIAEDKIKKSLFHVDLTLHSWVHTQKLIIQN